MLAPSRLARRVMPLVVVVLAGAPVGLSGCGGSNDATKVRETLNQFSRATARKDAHAFCALLSARLTERFTAVGLTCDSAIAKAFADVQQPSVRVGRIQIKGSTAMAQVHSSAANQAPSDDTLALVKEQGHWRVATLTAPQRPPVAPRPPSFGARAPLK